MQKKLQSVLSANQSKNLQEVQSLRLGGIYGIHKVHAVSEDEALVFEHQALNRKVFAQGAITAAQWLQKKPVGFYTMEDLLSV